MDHRWNILVVDDNVEDRLEMIAALRAGFDRSISFTEAVSVDAALQRIQTNRYDCIVLDYRLPDGSALDLLRKMPRAHGAHESVVRLRDAAVVITDTTDSAVGRLVLSYGAKEFVPKGGTSGMLPFIVTRAVQNAIERHALDNVMLAQTRALQESAERIRIAENAAGVGIWDWDFVTQKAVVSDQYRTLYGLRADHEVTFENWMQQVHADDRDGLQESFRMLLDHNKDYSVEFRILHPTRGIRWMSGQGTLLRDGDGHPVRFIGANIDITEKKIARERMRDAAAEKDAFIAFIAHELRSPLAPIDAAVEGWMQRPDDSATVAKCGAIISRQVRQLTRLLDDLMDVARMAHQKLSIRNNRILLNDVLQNAIEMSQPLMRERQHTLEIEVPADSIPLDGDQVSTHPGHCEPSG